MSKRLFICLLILSSVMSYVKAEHIIGGDVRYKITGFDVPTNQFIVSIQVTIFRDISIPNPFALEQDLRLGIFRGEGENWQYIETLLIPIERPNNIELVIPENKCFNSETSDIAAGDKSFYTIDNIALDISDESYRLVYQRCCRNDAIVNIPNPRQTGAAFEVFISPEAQNLGNCSPQFDFDPNTVICLNYPQEISFAATDSDSDSLHYSFCNIVTAGGGRTQHLDDECDGILPFPEFCGPDLFSDIEFIAPQYSVQSPIAGQVPFVIDPLTGIISGEANLTGTFVFGVCIEEFRDDGTGTKIKIGELKRDFQINIVDCAPIQAVPFSVGNLSTDEVMEIEQDCIDSGAAISVENACSASVQLSNYTSADPENTSFEWVIDLGNGNQMVNTEDWEPVVNFPDVGTYDIFLTINKDEICVTNCMTQVNVTELFTADFNAEVPPDCTEGPITITNNSIIPPGFNYTWDLGDGNVINNADPQDITYAQAGDYTIKLIVEDAQGTCTATDSMNVSYNPLPQIVSVVPDRTTGCDTTLVRFDNLSIPEDNPYTIEWDFGDGGSSTEVNPEHLYTEEGNYDVRVRVESSADCAMDFNFDDWSIEILPAPESSFSFSPNPVTNPNQLVSFSNASQGAGGGFEWDFGDRSIGSTEDNPTHRYSDAGNYEVELVAFSNINMCTDTSYAIVPVSAIGDPIFPNAFQPVDGFNNEFRAVSVFDTFNAYELAVYDRWGQQVFISSEFDSGWNGRMENTGAHLPMGVYIWNVRYEVFVGLEIESRSKKGTVLLIR